MKAENQNTNEVQESATPDPAPAQETDWKAEARKWEDRAKANRTQVSQLQAKVDQLQGASSDLEKALERISALEQHNSALERNALIAQVASAKQVDPALLVGDTLEELETHADRLLAWRGGVVKQAAAPGLGHQPTNEPDISDTKQLVRGLFKE
ncbi:hypothetical protein [Trueperella pyogenes]